MNNLRGAKIIYQESKATQPSHLYFLQKDENYCEAIVTSESGAKRKLALIPNSTIDQVLTNGNTTSKSIILQSSFGGSDWENTVTPVGNYFKKNNISGGDEEEMVYGATGINSSNINGSTAITFAPKTKIAYITIPNESGIIVLDYQLNDYYKKTETFSQTEINNLLSTKQNNLGYTPENVSNKSDSYTANSSTTYASTKALVDGLATKLDKGTYTGTASDLYLNDQNLLQSLQNEQSARYSADQILENSKQKKLTVIPVTGNITLSELHNGAVLNVTNTCTITIPTGLDANFQCVIFSKGSVIVTFVNGGVTVYAPSGLLLKTDKMASLISTSANNFNLTGELATT